MFWVALELKSNQRLRDLVRRWGERCELKDFGDEAIMTSLSLKS
jgi:hypothetical protein